MPDRSYPLLEKIDGPEDLRKLSREELEALVVELRRFILQKLSPVGGHLASSLGVVELTIALHAVFDSPRDHIVWDVGHQCYAHKILTGRREAFPRIRQKGGISGFPRRVESPHDAFGTGHSSTSISAALGMAVARDLAKGDNKVIAVIGDGSMTAGLAFEGLNHAGHVGSELVVILNDNDMSISENVGALSSYLTRILTGDFYSKLRREVEEFLRSLPGIGQTMARFARKVEEHIKGFISPGMLFEELGFTYVGPIDGHNMGHLLTSLHNVKKFRKPVLVHVVTRKGRGFAPAEERPTDFHGVGPFDPCNGVCAPAPAKVAPSYTEIFSEALVRLAERNPKILAITAAMPEGTGLDRFRERFPERFFDVGIAEQHAVTFAAGLAAEGWIPVVAVYSTFLQRAYDQVVHDVALQNLPVVFALDRAGLVGADGATHHGVFDISYLRHVPGLSLLAPADGDELRAALAGAVAAGGPVALRYPRGSAPPVSENLDPAPAPVGKGRLVAGDAREPGVLVLSAGTVLGSAREAVRRAGEDGVQATLFDVRYVKPLDRDAILDLCSRCRGLVTVEENALAGGLGSSVLELLADAGARVPPMRRLGVPDRFVEHGTQTELRAEVGLDVEAILGAVRELAEGAARG